MQLSQITKLAATALVAATYSTSTEATSVGPQYLSIKVTNDYKIQADIPIDKEFDYLYALQLDVPRTFAWDSSASQFYQCTSDTECTLLTGDDVNNDEGDMYQFNANIYRKPDPGTFLRFESPSLVVPEYGVFPISFMLYFGGDNPHMDEYVTTIYKLDPASSEKYTYVPTTTCVGPHCYSTSIPEIKETKTSVIDGKTSTIMTYGTISYEPVTVRSTATVTTFVVETGTVVVTTYCPVVAITA